jgi:hypothetical protein
LRTEEPEPESDSFNKVRSRLPGAFQRRFAIGKACPSSSDETSGQAEGIKFNHSIPGTREQSGVRRPRLIRSLGEPDSFLSRRVRAPNAGSSLPTGRISLVS